MSLLADEAAAPGQWGDGDGPAWVTVPLDVEAGCFEGSHDLVADGSGGLGRAVEAAIKEHESVAGCGGICALGVEVDVAAGVGLAFTADLGLAAATATGEVLARP